MAVKVPKTGTEREMLHAMLDAQREVILWKLAKLTEENARMPVVESGTSLLGITKHLAFVELWWFVAFADSQDVDFPWSDEDPDADWRVETDDTIESVTALYGQAVARSDHVINSWTDLDQERGSGGKMYSFRWILLHMIEETARHAGHADIARELVDGTTGYMPRG